jgi:hypothetical protein
MHKISIQHKNSFQHARDAEKAIMTCSPRTTTIRAAISAEERKKCDRKQVGEFGSAKDPIRNLSSAVLSVDFP